MREWLDDCRTESGTPPLPTRHFGFPSESSCRRSSTLSFPIPIPLSLFPCPSRLLSAFISALSASSAVRNPAPSSARRTPVRNPPGPVKGTCKVLRGGDGAGPTASSPRRSSSPVPHTSVSGSRQAFVW